MERNLAYLLPANMHKVFEETDARKREAAIADLWDEEGVFIDPAGVHQGYEAINAAAAALLGMIPGLVFKLTSPVQEQFGVGYVPWEHTPLSGAATLKGIDVGQMKGGKLLSVYAFVSAPPASR